jgi:GNAT superfamily N-acetyltransferase
MESAIRLFREEDIPFGMRLKSIAGWNQTPDDWRRFLSLSPGGCFVAEVAGQPAGTGTTTPYGDRFGWVGMILVLPEFRRRGLGTAMLNHAITCLEEGGAAAVRLDATPLGKKLYDTLGFADEHGLKRVEGIARAAGGRGMRLTAEALDSVCRFDAARFGADRSRMLELLWRQSPELCFLSRGAGGALTGYVMARPGDNAFQIGPWVASTPAAAGDLFATVLSALDGNPVFLDIPLVRPEPSAIVEQHGFTTQRPFIRMYRGRLLYPGKPDEIYAICGVETG